MRCLRKQVSRVLNPQVLYLADKDGWQRGLTFATLFFTGETPQDCDRVLGLYQRGGSLGDRRTAGLYYRTVE